MKPADCSICRAQARVYHSDTSHGAAYGVSCDEGHSIRAMFETKRRAIAAWDECQRFVEEYTEEV